MPPVVTVQAEFADGPLARLSRPIPLPVPERLWWLTEDAGDQILVCKEPDPSLDAIEYRRSAGPIGGVAIYRQALKP